MSRSVIVFAGALHDSSIWTNRQHVTMRLADRGWRVLYVEPRLFWARMLIGGYPETGFAWKWLVRTNIPLRIRHNMWVVSQVNIIPGGREVKLISNFNHWNNKWYIRFHAKRLGLSDASLLLYDTEAAQYLRDFPDARVVYDCVDDHKAQAGVDRNPDRVEEEEQAIARRADAISVTTQPLLRRFSALNPNTHLVPNAADIRQFLARPESVPDDIAAIPHPRIGSVGTIDPYKIDTALLREIASRHPNWQFVMIGPVTNIGKKGSALPALPNIHFLGTKPRNEIPAYVHAMDAAVIPYQASEYNRSSFPLKFWEYMASGVPVVSSGLPSLEQYAHLAPVAHSVDEFDKHVGTALADPDKGRDERITEAKRHDYNARVDAIEEMLL